MDRQRLIRAELVETEARLAHAQHWYLRMKVMNWQVERYYENVLHWEGRRRFFIRDLQKAQIKEFNNERLQTRTGRR